MRFWLRFGWLIIPITLGLWLGPLLKEQSSYVLIEWNQYSIETNVPLLLVFLSLFILVLLALIRCVSLLQRSSHFVWRWRSRRRQGLSQRWASEAALALLQGDTKAALRGFTKAAGAGEVAWVWLTAAAWSAQQQGEYAKRDQLLARAMLEQPDAEVPLLVQQIRWLEQQGESELAWQQLQQHRQLLAKNRNLQQLWCEMALARGEVEPVLLSLGSDNCLSGQQQQRLELQAWQQKLANSCLQSQSADELRVLWFNLPTALQQAESLALVVRGLWRLNQPEQAADLLSQYLVRHWDENLVDLYGRCRVAEPILLLKQAETWLTKRPSSPALLRSLGRLAARQALWAVARDYLQRSLALSASPDAWALLAQVALKLQDRSLADNSYQQALALVVQRGQDGKATD